MNALEDLLGSEEPHATFHDARLLDVAYDPVARTAALTAQLCTGNPDAGRAATRERRRTGVLELRGVAHWRNDGGPLNGAPPGTWLADDGPLAKARGRGARELARHLRADQVGWYFFLADSNSYLYWVATDAAFRWMPDGARDA